MDRAELLIVGAGVIGLSIALEVHRRGIRNIRILDKGAVGREASWAAAGILAPQVEADIDDDFFKLCFESNKLYPQFAAELLDETGVDIELDTSGTIYLGFDETDRAEFRRRFEWQQAAGLNIERLTAAETLKLEPLVSPDVVESLFLPDEGQVENRKLVAALLRNAEVNGIEVSENLEVKRVLTANGRTAGIELKSGETIEADTVVIASGAWTSQIEVGESFPPVEVKPVRGQMICYRQPQPKVRHVTYSHHGYLVPRADGRLLAGATVEDVGFDRATTTDGVLALKKIAEGIMPALGEAEIIDKWAGLRPFVPGGYPVIGPVPSIDGLFIATGHFRNGILLAPITARLIADMIAGTFRTAS